MENKEIILKILNELKNGNIPVHTDYNFNIDMWADLIEYMHDRAYIADVTIYWFDDDDTYNDERVYSVDLSKVIMTTFGERFLTEEMN
ncbi:MAG TPA: hypothetical protein DEB37_19615 [Lysinibacillus sp.]|uniref:hypothetical protein n=1 Tax=unclassified Lysinibacillus TaxID=2636778 RepID=UPI000E998F1A|nr:hypothetical protein [Lysinibacillus sp. OF-1]WCH49657.1 hypothetical protein NV349_09845 [Lysinibacillus sp. OF-1]HBT74353.1 hypothetical protein [Lysinibacillus sp.]